MKTKTRIIARQTIYCPDCVEDTPLEIVWRTHGEYDVEIYSCGFPENKPGLVFVKGRK